CGHSYAEAIGFAAIALLLLGVRRGSAALKAAALPLHSERYAFIVAALAGGVLAAAHLHAGRDANDAALAALPAERFVTVEAPIDADWRERGDTYSLRCQRPTVNGQRFDVPL